MDRVASPKNTLNGFWPSCFERYELHGIGRLAAFCITLGRRDHSIRRLRLIHEWVRPSPEVQAKIWNQGRYSGAQTADQWTHDFIIIDDPLSASGADHLPDLSGLWTAKPINSKCEANPDWRRNPDKWIQVWVLLHRVTQLTYQDNTYTVTVQPTGKGFQFVYFPRLNPSVVVRFVTSDGKQLDKWESSLLRPARPVG